MLGSAASSKVPAVIVIYTMYTSTEIDKGLANHTSSLVSDSAVKCWRMALRASYIKASVSGEPISHLSRREMKILKGRDSEYSPEGVNISF